MRKNNEITKENRKQSRICQVQYKFTVNSTTKRLMTVIDDPEQKHDIAGERGCYNHKGTEGEI